MPFPHFFGAPRRGTRLILDLLRAQRGMALIGLASLALVDLLDIMLPLLIAEAIDAVTRGEFALLQQLALIYLGVAVVQAFGRFGWRRGLYLVGVRSAAALRRRLVRHLLRLPTPTLERRKTGECVALAHNEVEAVRQLLDSGMVTLFDAAIYLVGISAALIYLSPKLALLALALFPLIPILVLKNQPLLREAAENVQIAQAAVAGAAHEGIGAVRLLKAFVEERSFTQRLQTQSQRLVGHSLVAALRDALFAPKLELVVTIAMTWVFIIGGGWVIEGSVTIGAFVAFERYLEKLLWPTEAVGIWFGQLQRALSGAERLCDLFDDPAEVTDATVVRSNTPAKLTAADALLSVRELRFSYQDAQSPALNGISFDLRRGEKVALIGESGSGKTTLLSLLAGIYPPLSGTIRIFDRDLQDWPLAELRRRIALVEQAPFLFHDSIAHNLSPRERPIADLEAVTRQAAVLDEVCRLPGAFSALLGERGVSLSGGQRQRLAIARAFLHQPELLLWDNALSSVDLNTEVEILAGLRGYGVTMLICTHRISTVLAADRILVLQNGRITQQGRHEELIRDSAGWYRCFYDYQRRREELEAYGGAR